MSEAERVSIHLNQFVHASTGRMRVGIDKTGSDKHAFSVDNFSAASGQSPDICTGANRQKTVSLDGEGLRLGFSGSLVNTLALMTT